MSKHPLDCLTDWMEYLDDKSLDELRQIRRAMGHDVERSERQFLEQVIDRLKGSLDGDWEEVDRGAAESEENTEVKK